MSQRIKYLDLEVLSLVSRQSGHCIQVLHRSPAVLSFTRIIQENTQCSDELPLPFRTRPEPLSLLDFTLRFRNFRVGERWLPQLMEMRHGDAPMSDCALRILFGNAAEGSLRRSVSE